MANNKKQNKTKHTYLIEFKINYNLNVDF